MDVIYADVLSDKGVPFAHYKNPDWDALNKKGPLAFLKMMLIHKWEIDIGIPCPESTPGEGRIQAKQLDAGKFLRAIHIGPYMKVGNTYKSIQAFARELEPIIGGSFKFGPTHW